MIYSYYIYDSIGNRTWYQYVDNMHREDGPAIENKTNGIRYWVKNNKLHRNRMPAVIWGSGYIEYHENGVFIKSERLG